MAKKTKKLRSSDRLAQMAAQEEVDRIASVGYRATVAATFRNGEAVVLISRPATSLARTNRRYESGGIYGFVAKTYGYSDEGIP